MIIDGKYTPPLEQRYRCPWIRKSYEELYLQQHLPADPAGDLLRRLTAENATIQRAAALRSRFLSYYNTERPTWSLVESTTFPKKRTSEHPKSRLSRSWSAEEDSHDDVVDPVKKTEFEEEAGDEVEAIDTVRESITFIYLSKDIPREYTIEWEGVGAFNYVIRNFIANVPNYTVLEQVNVRQ